MVERSPRLAAQRHMRNLVQAESSGRVASSPRMMLQKEALNHLVAPAQRVVQRVVNDEDGKVIDANAAYSLIYGKIGDHDSDSVLSRIEKLATQSMAYSPQEIIEDLTEQKLIGEELEEGSEEESEEASEEASDDEWAYGEEEYEEDSETNDREKEVELKSHSFDVWGEDGIKEIGGKRYKQDEKVWLRDDGTAWHIKDSDRQRSYAEKEYLGAKLYGEIVGQQGATELHYHEDKDLGVIVKEHLPNYRNWASGLKNYGATDYDAKGLGHIAVAAWFLGDEDMHAANFGTAEDSEAPQLAVVDASGALHEDNLALPMEADDYKELPLPPREWVHSPTGWQLHGRSTETQSSEREVLLSASVNKRLPDEKEEALNRIQRLDFDVFQQKLMDNIFMDGNPLSSLKNGSELLQKLLIHSEWESVRPLLEERKRELSSLFEGKGGGRKKLRQI